MTKARTNASASPAVGRNMVINGAMNVAQRSASVTGLGANADAYNTLDRFKLGVEGTTAGRLTMSQVADGPNGISANCLKLDCTTADTSIAATEFVGVSTYLEGQNVQRLGKGIAGAKQSVISFYVKASSSLTFAVELFDADNARHIVKLFTATTAWNRIEFYIPADEDDGSSALDDDNATSLSINFWIHGGSNFTGGTLATAWANKTNNNTRAAGIDSFFSSTDNNLFLTGVQFEVGPVATEFEQEDFGVTLAKCERYFQKWDVEATLGAGLWFSGVQLLGNLSFRQIMRTSPTMSVSSADFVKAYKDGEAIDSNDSASPFDLININSARFNLTMASAATDGMGALIQLQGSEYIHVDAEL